jgi:hypothetical protein
MQTDLDDSEAVLPELSLPENQLCDIKINETDAEDVLSILNPSKASGPGVPVKCETKRNKWKRNSSKRNETKSKRNEVNFVSFRFAFYMYP